MPVRFLFNTGNSELLYTGRYTWYNENSNKNADCRFPEKAGNDKNNYLNVMKFITKTFHAICSLA